MCNTCVTTCSFQTCDRFAHPASCFATQFATALARRMTKILQALRAGQVMMNSEIQKYQQEQWFNNVQPKCSKTSSLLYSCRPVVTPRQ
jgi:hypothetical protein